MTTLTWDWSVFAGVVLVGLAVGRFVTPFTWPARVEFHDPPPLIAPVIGLVSVGAFVGFLNVFRLAAEGHTELQASVLLVCYVLAVAGGLASHRRL